MHDNENDYKDSKKLNLFFFGKIEEKKGLIEKIKNEIKEIAIIKKDFDDRKLLLKEIFYYLGMETGGDNNEEINIREIQNVIISIVSHDDAINLLEEFVTSVSNTGIVTNDEQPFFIFLRYDENLDKISVINILNEFQKNIEKEWKLDSRNIFIEEEGTILNKIKRIYNYYNEKISIIDFNEIDKEKERINNKDKIDDSNNINNNISLINTNENINNKNNEYINNIINKADVINENNIINENNVVNENNIIGENNIINKNNIVNENDVINESNVVNKNNNISYDLSNTVNILVVGARGSGKSTLINRILGEKVAFAEKTAKTTKTNFYYHRYYPIKLIDTAGFEIGEKSNINDVNIFLKQNNLIYENLKNKIQFIFYLKNKDNKFEDIELEIIKKFISFNIEILCIFTFMEKNKKKK